jgi:hypothetical protein
MSLLRQPLFRLLAINLAIGFSVAVLMLGGLFALNPDGLRDLILADRSPATAAGLLLFGFLVTFGSVAMGTAIMSIGHGDDRGGSRRSPAPPSNGTEVLLDRLPARRGDWWQNVPSDGTRPRARVKSYLPRRPAP